MTDPKIIHLETLLAHHEAQIQDLSAMIAAQWQEIDRMKRQLESALAKIEDRGSDPAAAKPPHY